MYKFLRLFLPLALLLVAGIHLYGRLEIERELSQLRSRETAGVKLGAGALSGRIGEISRDLRFLAVHGAMRSASERPTSEHLAHLVEDFTRFSATKEIFDQIRWIDETGLERVRVDYNQGRPLVIPAERLQNKGQRYYFTDAIKLEPGEVFISPLDLNIEQNSIELPYKPMIRLATPVADPQGVKRGIVILNYYGAEMLRDFGMASAEIGDHVMVTNAEGYWLKSPVAADEWGFMFKRPELSLAARAPAAWRHIVGADQGQITLADGVWSWETVYPVLAGQRTSAGSPEAHAPSPREIEARQYFWKSVAHLSTDRMDAVRQAIWFKMTAIAGLLLGLTGLGSWKLASAWSSLASAEEKYHTVADFTLDWETWIEPGGNYRYCSPSCERLTGHPARDFMDDPRFVLAITHEEDRERVREHLDNHIIAEGPGELTFRIRLPDGGVRWLEHACLPVFDKAGEFLGRRGSNRDITLRKELFDREQALTRDLAAKSRLFAIIGDFQGQFIHQPDPVLMFDALLKEILAVTDSEYGFIGDVLQDEAGRDYLKCYAFSNIAWDEVTRRFYEENKATGFVFRKLDNLFGHVILDRAPVISNDPERDPRHAGIPSGHPKVSAFLGIPVWYGDRLVGEIGLANRPGGYDQALLDGIQPVVEACGRIIVARWEREARERAEAELRRYKDHLETLVAQRTADLSLAKEAAEAANRAKTLFLSSMSHELRTPLNAILGFAQILERDGRIPEDERGNIAIINRSGNHLLALINDLLEVSRIEAGRTQVARDPLDLHDLLDRVVDVLNPRARDKGLELRLERGAELPSHILGDAGKLRQILLHLLSNGLKYTERGEVVLHVGVSAGDAATLVFEVRDSGVGIEAEALERIFQPFFKAGYGDNLGDGAGLGLAICRDYVRLLGGELSAESTLGEGSVFRFSLSLSALDANKAGGARHEASAPMNLVFSKLDGNPSLAGMGEETRRRLRLAALSLDGEAVQALAMELSGGHPEISRHILRLAEGYRFDSLLDLLGPGE